MDTEAKNEQLAKRFPNEVATDGDVDLIDEICARNVIEHGPFGATEGREELKTQIHELHAAFPDFSATVEDAVADGDRVAMRVTLSGTHQGTFQGIDPTDNTVEIQSMVFTRIEDRRIAERWLNPDMLGLIRQLGTPTETETETEIPLA